MIRFPISSSMWSSRADSSSVSLKTGDAGRRAQDFSDLLLVDLGRHVGVADLPGLLLLRALREELLLLVAQPAAARSPGVDRRLFLEAYGCDPLVELARSGGAVIRLIRSRAPASSMRSMALSGRKRSEMYDQPAARQQPTPRR